MSDPSVDLEKGITGLKEEAEKGITGLKEKKKKVADQFEHLKAMCMTRSLDVALVLFFAGFMFAALCFYKRYHVWWPDIFLASFAIMIFWTYCRMKHFIASGDSDLSTTLLTSSKKEANMPAELSE